jgi:hypothetical protein
MHAVLVGGTTPVKLFYPEHTQAISAVFKIAKLPPNQGFAAGIDTRPEALGRRIPLNYVGVSHEWEYNDEYTHDLPA